MKTIIYIGKRLSGKTHLAKQFAITNNCAYINVAAVTDSVEKQKHHKPQLPTPIFKASTIEHFTIATLIAQIHQNQQQKQDLLVIDGISSKRTFTSILPVLETFDVKVVTAIDSSRTRRNSFSNQLEILDYEYNNTSPDYSKPESYLGYDHLEQFVLSNYLPPQLEIIVND